MKLNKSDSGARKESPKCGLDWISRGLFSLFMSVLSALGWIDSDGLPVGFHYVLCTSDLYIKKGISPSFPPRPPLPLAERTFPSEEKGTKLVLNRIARGDFFQCIYLISSSDSESPHVQAFFLLSKTLSSTLWGLHWNPASISLPMPSALMHTWVGPRCAPGRGRPTRGGGGYGNQSELLFVAPSRIPTSKLNSNKIRYRCALAAQTSIVHEPGWRNGHMLLSSELSDFIKAEFIYPSTKAFIFKRTL